MIDTPTKSLGAGAQGSISIDMEKRPFDKLKDRFFYYQSRPSWGMGFFYLVRNSQFTLILNIQLEAIAMLRQIIPGHGLNDLLPETRLGW